MTTLRNALIATGILATIGLGIAHAATGDRHGGPAGRGPHMNEWIKTMDSNGDGLLQKDEVQARLDAIFADADANKDGALSEDEIRDQFLAMRNQRFDDRFAALDADKSGGLTPDELKGRDGKLFERADADKDGVVTKQELRDAFTRKSPNAAK